MSLRKAGRTMEMPRKIETSEALNRWSLNPKILRVSPGLQVSAITVRAET